MHIKTEIAPGHESDPPCFSKKTMVCGSVASKFFDAAYWDKLADKHLPQHDMPSWSVRCDPEAMRQWLYRLGLNERDHLKATATSLKEFAALNPNWPLRAWIGTALELAEHGGKRRENG